MVILGSTGSIGVNTLEVCRRFDIEVEALVAGDNLQLLQKQIDEFKPKLVAIANPNRINEIKHPHIYTGDRGILELLQDSSSPKVVNALVGYAGLAPTLKALELGRTLALANKESLVIAGAFLEHSKIIPIDSEHFGLWYLLNNRPINRLIITASGGAFRDWDISKIYNASYAQALKHPNWSMGNKITIDSASMVNKLFELLEAYWLFGNRAIDAFIERKSIVHALIEFKDGSTTAHFADVDMKLPIAYALNSHIDQTILKPIDLLSIGEIKFEQIDTKRYPLWQLKEELLSKPRLGVVLNASNEEAIRGFSQGEYNFGKMCDLILKAWEEFKEQEPNSLGEVMELDKRVRAYVTKQK